MRSIAVLVVATLALVLVAASSATAQDDMEIDILFPTEEGYDILEEGNQEMLDEENAPPKPAPPCCDHCVCTKKRPPQCQCTDVLPNRCHTGCKKCVCTKSRPPKCRCLDVKPRCDPHCPPKFV